MKIDGTELAKILALIGERDPGDDTADLLAAEAAIGKRFPEETRALLRANPTLEHPHAEGHPEIAGSFPSEFYSGLPDVDAFLEALAKPYLGRFLSSCHFMGLFPIGAQVQYGDFMYALVCVEQHSPGLGGVMYYDEREVGTWGATCSAFLHRAIDGWWQQIDGQVDGMEEEELAEFEPDPSDTRDCFILEAYDWRTKPPEAEALPEKIEKAWKKAWRRNLDLRTERWWMPSFLRGKIDSIGVRQMPTEAEWKRDAPHIANRYADAMYWTLTHAILDNGPELNACLDALKDHPGTNVRAICDAAPGLAGRFEKERKQLYSVARKVG